MHNTRNITQYREEDVDQKVGIAATLQEDPNWWEEDGENDFADITAVPQDVSILLIWYAQGEKASSVHAPMDLGMIRGEGQA
jgi:hypothetical protein